MPEISQQTQKLLQRYQTWYQSLQKKEGVPVLHVDEVASKVAEEIAVAMDTLFAGGKS